MIIPISTNIILIHNYNIMETFLLPYAQRVSVEIVEEDADYREQYFRSSSAMTWKRKYSMKLERNRLIMLLQKENTSFKSQRRVTEWPIQIIAKVVFRTGIVLSAIQIKLTLHAKMSIKRQETTKQIVKNIWRWWYVSTCQYDHKENK